MATRFKRAVLLAVIPAFFLAACGGGGGGDSASAGGSTGSTGSTGGSGGSGSSTVAGVVITTTNAQALAAEALEVSSSADAASTGAAFVTGVEVSGGSGSNPLQLASAVRTLLPKLPASGSLATGVVTEQVVSCTNGGSLSITVNSSGAAVLTAGDSYQIVASNCTEGTGDTALVMNGSVTISIVSGSYDPAGPYPRTVTMRVVANNFSVSGGGVSESFSSDMTFTLTETSATSASVSISNATVTSTIGSHTVTLSNYSLSASETDSGTTVTMSATVQTNNSRLGSGTVTYTVTTVTPITVSSSGVVTAGAIRVTGNGSSLLLTVTGPDTFSLQVDSNGDGTYDATTAVTRSELNALL